MALGQTKTDDYATSAEVTSRYVLIYVLAWKDRALQSGGVFFAMLLRYNDVNNDVKNHMLQSKNIYAIIKSERRWICETPF